MEGVTRRTCITVGSVPVLAGLAAYVVRDRGLLQDDAGSRFRAPGSAREAVQQRHLPNVPLVTHDGKRVRFYDDLVRDKKVVLTFISSRALADSKKVTSNLAALQRLFGRRIGTEMFMYSIARTPEHDTPAVLRSWAARSGAGWGWKFLTGAPADIETLRHGLGFASEDPVEDADPAYSVGLLRYGAEPEMRWAHCQSQAAPRVLAHSMLLDFGVGSADPSSPIFRRFGSRTASGAAPVWNCELLLSGVE
jgi:protein SCO1/2